MTQAQGPPGPPAPPTPPGARIVLVPGGTRGLGRAIALSLAGSGWSVAACSRTGAEERASLAAEVEARGARALVVACDVVDPAACAALVARVEAELGGIDALVHAAGPFHRVPLLEESDAAWRATFDANLHALFTLSRLVAPGMIARRWGRILAFSVAGAGRLAGQPAITAYATAKAGVLVLTRSLARVLGPHGITANTISPGFLDSGGTPSEELAAMVPRIPAGYVGEPRDAVAAAQFLLSEEARYVNGADLLVSGGWGA